MPEEGTDIQPAIKAAERLIGTHYHEIADTAAQGFKQFGRGAVCALLDDNGMPDADVGIGYMLPEGLRSSLPASALPRLMRLIGSYDPQRQIVVCIYSRGLGAYIGMVEARVSQIRSREPAPILRAALERAGQLLQETGQTADQAHAAILRGLAESLTVADLTQKPEEPHRPPTA